MPNILGESISPKKREDIHMNRRISTCTMIFLFAFATGCKTQVSDQDAIRTGIDKHLSGLTGMNMSAMDREVKQVFHQRGPRNGAGGVPRQNKAPPPCKSNTHWTGKAPSGNVVGSHPKWGKIHAPEWVMPPPASPGGVSNSNTARPPPRQLIADRWANQEWAKARVGFKNRADCLSGGLPFGTQSKQVAPARPERPTWTHS